MTKKTFYAYKTIGEVAEILNLVNSKNGSLSTHTPVSYTHLTLPKTPYV